MRRSPEKTDRLEEKALTAFLIACFFMALVKEFYPGLDKGLDAALFVAVFFVLKQVRDLRVDVLEAGRKEIFFATNEEFYSCARAAVQQAKREVRVTYFRSAPPTRLASSESKEYFAEVVKFAGRGTVRRIVGVPNRAVAEWCASEAELVRANPNYHCRVILTVNQPIEPMSACLIDDDIMFMAFSGPTDQQLGGIREYAPKLVQFHQNRFDQLWALGTDLTEFVASTGFADHPSG